MTPRFSSYVICATPRSGSTLLCRMLRATGRAGRPESYFRREDMADWADYWGIQRPSDIDAPGFDEEYLAAMVREGRAGTELFGLRIMWGSLEEASVRLRMALGVDADVASLLNAAFGPQRYVHLTRRDKVAQAVSRLRAEQSGTWHLKVDGSVLEGGSSEGPLTFDRSRIAALVNELRRDDASWNAFFRKRRITPARLVYETMADDPERALSVVLIALGLDPAIAKHTPIDTAKMAGAESEAWVARYRGSADR